MNIRTLGIFALAGLLASCSPTPIDEDTGTEADAPEIDVPMEDAAPPLDAGNDRDGDGIDDVSDCAPDDPLVGSSGTRSCSSACGDGMEVCTGGVWGTCSAPTDCTCTTEGETRLGACGRCGEHSEQCLGGFWEVVSLCLGQGECSVGELDSLEGPRCRLEQRLCGADCAWGPWDLVHPEGVCDRGWGECIRNPDGTYTEQYCTPSCALSADNPCCPPTDPPASGCS